jgi:hypothetical protein
MENRLPHPFHSMSTPVENFPFVAGENCTLGQGDEP